MNWRLFRKPRRNYSQRCADIFLVSHRALRIELGDIITRHSAEGVLRSGATIRRSIAAFENHTSGSVKLLQQEFGMLIQSRGREWRYAMDAIAAGIEGQLRNARHVLDRPFRIANGTPGEPVPKETSVAHVIDYELLDVGERLRRQQAAFRDGWTAPIEKPWNERHPILYAATAAICGALITAIIAAITPR